VYVRIDISDNGQGMNGEQQLRCFEPFYTTKNVDPGTGVGLSGSGLGLSAAYSIVKQHNGLITVTSELGGGSTFSIYLPIQVAEDAVVSVSQNGGPRSTIKGGVLLLGLEMGAQPFVSSLLESLGYRSRSVYDLTQARDVLSRESHTWGFILVDTDTLGEQILDQCKQLTEKFADLGLLAMSAAPRDGSASPPTAREAFLEKPLGVWSVESALQRLKRQQAAT
jgi:hypothetical protein